MLCDLHVNYTVCCEYLEDIGRIIRRFTYDLHVRYRGVVSILRISAVLSRACCIWYDLQVSMMYAVSICRILAVPSGDLHMIYTWGTRVLWVFVEYWPCYQETAECNLQVSMMYIVSICRVLAMLSENWCAYNLQMRYGVCCEYT